jgi:hypothetical protein
MALQQWTTALQTSCELQYFLQNYDMTENKCRLCLPIPDMWVMRFHCRRESTMRFSILGKPLNRVILRLTIWAMARRSSLNLTCRQKSTEIKKFHAKAYFFLTRISKSRDHPLVFDIFEPTTRQIFWAERRYGRADTYLLMWTVCHYCLANTICTTCSSSWFGFNLCELRKWCENLVDRFDASLIKHGPIEPSWFAIIVGAKREKHWTDTYLTIYNPESSWFAPWESHRGASTRNGMPWIARIQIDLARPALRGQIWVSVSLLLISTGTFGVSSVVNY